MEFFGLIVPDHASYILYSLREWHSQILSSFFVSFHVSIQDELAEDDEATLSAIFDNETMDTFENFIPGVNSCRATSQFDLDPSAEKVSQELLHKPFEMLKQELISENPKPMEYANCTLGTVEEDVRETCESDHDHILKPEMIKALNDMLAKAADGKFSHVYCEPKVLAEQQKIYCHYSNMDVVFQVVAEEMKLSVTT